MSAGSEHIAGDIDGAVSENRAEQKLKRKRRLEQSMNNCWIMTLNQRRPDLKYNTIVSGPDHSPTFTIRVETDGQVQPYCSVFVFCLDVGSGEPRVPMLLEIPRKLWNL